MKHRTHVTVLGIMVIIAAGIAAGVGIFSDGGPGTFEYQTIRGETVTMYGQGLYKHMSADVAVQGIGQDYVTLFLAVPALAVTLLWVRKGTVRSRLFLAGVFGYFLVTYLFYLVMAMYNALFLLYAFLLGTSFFGLILTLMGFDLDNLKGSFGPRSPVRFCGGLLLFNAAMIGLLWSSVVVPPLLDGSIYPVQLQHYTTLIVQGLDLGLLLPLSVVSGLLLIRRRPVGFLAAPVYLVFLSFLMTALVAKLVAMGMTGVSIIPSIFIIPAICLVTIGSAIAMLRSVSTPGTIP